MNGRLGDHLGHGHGLPDASSRGGEPGAVTADPAVHRRVVRLLVILLVPLMLATAYGMVALWPSGDPAEYLPADARFTAPGVIEVVGQVTEVKTFACPDFSAPGEGSESAPTGVCGTAQVRLGDGPENGQVVAVDIASSATSVGVVVGTTLRLLRIPPAEDQPQTYVFSDFDRTLPMGLLALAFAVCVVAVARLRGLLALVGLGVAFAILVKFVLPALLSGEEPLLVGIVGSAAIMFVVLYLAHGVSIRTTTALLGTLFGLAVAALLGYWAVDATHLTGAATEEGILVRSVANRIELSGILLTGIVIAGMGVLNDVTVTQASAVWELHRLDQETPARRLFSGGMRIGRDHIASSVYTIVFAYAGSALPVLLLIDLYQRSLGLTLTSEAVAEEVVSILVGAIALVLSVPLTTAVAVALVSASGARPGRERVRRHGTK